MSLKGKSWWRRASILRDVPTTATANASDDVRPESYKYRDMLERWAAWWNGPGREGFRGNWIPPITETGELLRCIGCANGNDLPQGEWCRACGHKE